MKESLLKGLFFVCAFMFVLAVALIFVFVAWKAWPIVTDYGLGKFITGTEWSASNESFGILPLIVGSLDRDVRRARARNAAGGRYGGVPLGGRVAEGARGRATGGRAARGHPVGRLRLLRHHPAALDRRLSSPGRSASARSPRGSCWRS